MFSILKKFFARISGKAEKQVFRENKSQLPDAQEKMHRKRKSDRKNRANQDMFHKKRRKTSAEQKPAVAIEQVQEKKPFLSMASGKKNRKADAKKCNRHGIPVYEKHTDFSKYFTEESQKSDAGAKERQPRAKPDSVREKTDRESRSKHPVPEKTNRTPVRKQIPGKKNFPLSRSAHPRNKHGIPLFGSEDDLSRYFKDEYAGEQYRQSPERSTRFSQHSLNQSVQLSDRDDNFQKLLHQSLAENSMEEMLKKKFGGLPPTPPQPMRKKIAAYPPPQEVMDLHGCTAEQAEEKTEAFIRRARHKGMRTLLIIVGKGLHSEGKAVLPDVVENRLLVLKQKNWVLSYEWEKKIPRKSGAMIVYLNDIG